MDRKVAINPGYALGQLARALETREHHADAGVRARAAVKVFVDENIPGITVAALREAGHDVLDIRGTEEEGSTDEVVWQLAHAQGRLLITTDKGFVLRRDDFARVRTAA